MKQFEVGVLETKAQMRDFVTHCDRELEEKMRGVARRIAATPDLKLLGLTGPTCSGKTTAAKILTDYLEAQGFRVHVISIDDFYYDLKYLDQRADANPEIEIDYDSEATIDIGLLAQKTASLLAGKVTEMPRFDFTRGERTIGKTLKPGAKDVFLFEGIQILYPKVHAILSGESYRSIYIYPSSAIAAGGELFEPNEIRLMRRLVRDYRYRATAPEFTFYLWQSVRENEEKNIFPNAHTCHEQIDSTLPYEVGMLKPYLEQILSAIPRESEYSRDTQKILDEIASVQVLPSDLIGENSLYKEFI